MGRPVRSPHSVEIETTLRHRGWPEEVATGCELDAGIGEDAGGPLVPDALGAPPADTDVAGSLMAGGGMPR